MNSKYFCDSCQFEFEAEGKKLEYRDKFYGPCWKMVATCPNCKSECNEVRKTSFSKKSVDFDSYVNELRNRNNRGGCCGGGGCCG